MLFAHLLQEHVTSARRSSPCARRSNSAFNLRHAPLVPLSVCDSLALIALSAVRSAPVENASHLTLYPGCTCFAASEYARESRLQVARRSSLSTVRSACARATNRRTTDNVVRKIFRSFFLTRRFCFAAVLWLSAGTHVQRESWTSPWLPCRTSARQAQTRRRPRKPRLAVIGCGSNDRALTRLKGLAARRCSHGLLPSARGVNRRRSRWKNQPQRPRRATTSRGTSREPAGPGARPRGDPQLTHRVVGLPKGWEGRA